MYEREALNDDDKEAPINPQIKKSKGLLGFAVVKGTMMLEKMGTVDNDKAEGGARRVGDGGGATRQRRRSRLYCVFLLDKFS